MPPVVRTLLTVLAAVVGFLAAADPFGLPAWASGLVAVAGVALAAVGIVPPQMGGVQRGNLSTPELHGPKRVSAKRRSELGITSTKRINSFWPIAVVPFAEINGSDEHLLGLVIVVLCLLGAIVVAVRSRDWLIPLVLCVVALFAAILLL